MRAPVVAGAGGGVGTTTVAVGLRGHDAGRVAGLRPGHRPDILVCRASIDSVQRAAAVLDEVDHEPAPPVLAVTLTGTWAPRGPLRARLELLEADAAAVVLLPHVRRWGALVDPLAEAAQLLVAPATQLPRPLRSYAAALRDLAAAVAGSGRLDRRPDDRHARRTGSDERAVRRNGHGLGAPPPEPARPPVVGAHRPGASPASRGASTAGPPSAELAQHLGRTPASPDVDRRVPADTAPRDMGRQPRRGVRILAPDGMRPATAPRTNHAPEIPTAAGGGPSARRVAAGAPPGIAEPIRPAGAPAAEAATALGAGGRRPEQQDANDPAERVGQVG